ncbi:MAG TPA: GAF domain-containing sensor histidine kinase [Candidatus Aphodovivens avistercoris]|nr:GAF domain-containing sensor histidine kinase [Candidatus Aphodovivens avistercoris]
MAESGQRAFIRSLHACAARAAEDVRERFGLDFVGVSIVPDGSAPILTWQYGAGSTTGNYALIHLPEGVGALGKVQKLRRGLVVNSVEDDIPQGELFQYPIIVAEALASFLSFPLMEGDRLRVILICATRFVRTFDEVSCGLMQQYAAERFSLMPCGEPPLEVHGKQEGFAYTEITHRLLQAQEDERRRIARELHDGISQEVLVAQIELRKLGYLPQEEWPAAVDAASGRLKDVIAHISAIARALRPAALDELGLVAALEALCATMEKAFGVRVTRSIADPGPLGSDKEIVLYRICQEALSNACKYSGADEVRVSLVAGEGRLILRVADDGTGFDPHRPQAKGSGLGLGGMRERAGLVGGSLEIDAASGEGCAVTLAMALGGAQ